VLTIFIMVPVGRQMYKDAGNVQNTRDIFSEASVKTLFDSAQKAKEPLRRFLSAHSHVKDRELFMDLAVRLEASAQPRPKGQTAEKPPEPTPQAPAGSSPVPTTPTGQAATAAPPVSASANPAAQAPAALSQPATPAPAPSSPPLERPDKNDFQVLIPSFVTSQLKEAFEVGFLIFVPFIVVDMVIANILLAMGMQMLSPTVISLPFKLLLFVLVDGWFLIVRGLVLSYT
jgi:flagellar biosynthesis protein FliP